jgi:hypothetical protein
MLCVSSLFAFRCAIRWVSNWKYCIETLYCVIIYIKRNNFNKSNFNLYGFSSSFILKVHKFLFILNYYYCFLSCGFYFLCLIFLLFDVDDVVGIYVPSYCYFVLSVEFFLYLHSCVLPTNRGKHVNNLERYISEVSKQNQHLNDYHVITKCRFSTYSSNTTENKHELWKTPIEQATKSSTITPSTCSLTQECKYSHTQQITKAAITRNINTKNAFENKH